MINGIDILDGVNFIKRTICGKPVGWSIDVAQYNRWREKDSPNFAMDGDDDWLSVACLD